LGAGGHRPPKSRKNGADLNSGSTLLGFLSVLTDAQRAAVIGSGRRLHLCN
jgi:hypothetical protein